MKEQYQYIEGDYEVTIKEKAGKWMVSVQRAGNTDECEASLLPLQSVVPPYMEENLRDFGLDPKKYFPFARFAIRQGAFPVFQQFLDDYMAHRKAMAGERNARLNALFPGLDLLKSAYADDSRYLGQFNQMMDDEDNDGARSPAPRKHDVESLKKEYPRADLYLKAEAYTNASHFEKVAAGKKAMAMLEDGCSLEAAEEVLNNWVSESSRWN